MWLFCINKYFFIDIFLSIYTFYATTTLTPPGRSNQQQNKKTATFRWLFFMVAGGGLEPPASGLWARRAANCSIPRYNVYAIEYLYTITYSSQFVKYYFLLFFVGF